MNIRAARLTTSKIASAVIAPLGIILTIVLVAVGLLGGYRLALIVTVGLVGSVAAFVSLELGVMALILVACLDGFLKGVSPGWHTQLLKDYILALCLLRWAWLSVLGHRRASVRHQLSIPIVLFAAWCGVQVLNDRNPNFFMALAGFRSWVIWLPVFFITYDYIRSRREIQRLVIFLLLVMTPLAAYGIVQYQIGFGHLHALGPGFDVFRDEAYVWQREGTYEVQLRPPSTMVSTHAFAMGAGDVALLAAGALGFFRRRRSAQLLAIGALPLLVIGMLITAVRSAVASVAAAAIIFLALVRRPGLALLVALVGIVAIIHVGELTGGTALKRMETIITEPEYTVARLYRPWAMALNWTSRHPLGGGVASGIGRGRMLWETAPVGSLPLEERTPWSENEYGRALIELGIPGFLLFIVMLAALTRQLLRARARVTDTADRWFESAVLAIVFAKLAELLVGSALYTWPTGIIFWVSAAAGIRLREIAADETDRAEQPARDTAADHGQ